MAHDNLSRERTVLVLFANYEKRLPKFLARFSSYQLSYGNGKRMSSNLKLTIIAGITANLKFAVAHMVLPLVHWPHADLGLRASETVSESGERHVLRFARRVLYLYLAPQGMSTVPR